MKKDHVPKHVPAVGWGLTYHWLPVEGAELGGFPHVPPDWGL